MCACIFQKIKNAPALAKVCEQFLLKENVYAKQFVVT